MFYIIMIAPVLIAMVAWVLVSAWLERKIPAHKRKTKTAFAVFSLIVLALIPTYDIIITNILGAYYCKNAEKNFIKEKIKFPASIYEDKKHLKEKDRDDVIGHYIINDYFDGINVTKIALNGDDGKIYLYYFDTNSSDFENLRTKTTEYYKLLKNEKEARIKFDLIVADKNNIGTKKHLEALGFWHKEENATRMLYNEVKVLRNSLLKSSAITLQEAQKLDYIAKLENIELGKFSSWFFKATKTSIINNTGELTGYNEEYYSHIYNLLPNVVDNSKYNHNTFCKCKTMNFGVGFLNVSCRI